MKVSTVTEMPAKVRKHFSRKSKSSEAGGAADPTPAPRKKWVTKLTHPTYQLIADICPQCGFPEAEGGYCEECGWSLPHPLAKRRK